MSHIPNGGANIYIAPHTNGNWWYNYNPGWPGVTFVQAQPLNTDAAMVCVPGKITFNSDGSTTFWTNIENKGPNSTHFNMQVSNT